MVDNGDEAAKFSDGGAAGLYFSVVGVSADTASRNTMSRIPFDMRVGRLEILFVLFGWLLYLLTFCLRMRGKELSLGRSC